MTLARVICVTAFFALAGCGLSDSCGGDDSSSDESYWDDSSGGSSGDESARKGGGSQDLGTTAAPN